MNIFDFDNKIYGSRKLKQGENVDFKLEAIEQQELLKMEIDNKNNFSKNSNYNKINKEIKF